MTKALSATRPHPGDVLYRIADEVAAECSAQDAKFGEQNHPDGTGLIGDRETADMARQITENAAAAGKLTWRLVLTEEVREAYAETDPEKLYRELKQVSAVAQQWMKAIVRRQGVIAPRVYVSGQITGLDRHATRANFDGDRAALEALSFEVVNPFDIPHPTDCSCPVPRDGEHLWECCLVKDLRVLVTCDAIYMRADWHSSRGAILEHDTAKALGLVIVYGAPDGTLCEVCEKEITAGQPFITLPGVGLYNHLACEPPSVQDAIAQLPNNQPIDIEIAEAMAHDLNDQLDTTAWWDIRENNGGWDDPRIRRAAEVADSQHINGADRYPAAEWCRLAVTAFHDIAGDYVRDHYKVPAHIHGKVTVDGVDGYIIGFEAAKLRVQLVDRAAPIIAHPTWRVTYHTTTSEQVADPDACPACGRLHFPWCAPYGTPEAHASEVSA